MGNPGRVYWMCGVGTGVTIPELVATMNEEQKEALATWLHKAFGDYKN